MKRLLSIFAAGIVGTIALPAFAQSAQDWNLLRDDHRKVVVAATNFDNGIGVAVRCIDRSLEAFISGLPEIEGDTRELRIRFPENTRDHTQTWMVAANSAIAISSFPAGFARDLREGGRLDIVVPGGAEGGRNLRYVLDLPASNAAIDETLTACNRPLIDPRDAEIEALPEGGLPVNIVWVSRPRPEYPTATNYVRGFASVMCLTNPNGSLRDCTAEAEYPRDSGFGDEAIKAARRARVGNADPSGGPVPLTSILYRTNFVLAGYDTREERERHRQQSERDREARQNRQE
tara:strand:- start:313 stop:1182 length:870 start_codon:yes stop_codon:yes gene_type:complete